LGQLLACDLIIKLHCQTIKRLRDGFDFGILDTLGFYIEDKYKYVSQAIDKYKYVGQEEFHKKCLPISAQPASRQPTATPSMMDRATPMSSLPQAK